MRFVKYSLFLYFILGLHVSSRLLDSDEDNERMENVDENSIDNDAKSGLTVEEKEIIFKYYNRDNVAGERIYIKNVTEDILKGWRKYHEVKFITHGWLSSEKSGSVEGIKNAYLVKKDINVITIDWSETASWKAYPLPAYFTKQVGAIIATLIEELVEKKFASLQNVHVIGHSLGSHVAGAVGSSVKSGKVARITGLDPAGPAFEHVHQLHNNVLDTSDAEFVDIIHTAGGAAGYMQPLGHADFYPNGGVPPQPGCVETSSLNVTCSHGRAYNFFADSILYPSSFRAYKCDTWEALKNASCNGYPIVYMGDETPSTARGIYYLRTEAKSPFGRKN
ncbi:lipase member H-like isoform X2 [Planococcus citri]|uniref:lipase member H-like isoform X2 n=1 Tax=Planococcus citri TaxID=170843 RepID=UPI0031F7AC8D